MEEKEVMTGETLVEAPIYELIHEIRGKQVMLDEDLARIYQVETRRLNQAVKRNIERFPLEFMFQLTNEEYLNLMSQFVISSSDSRLTEKKPPNLMSQFATSSWGGRRKLPFAFTEHGVIMLSSVLNSKIATQVNIAIVKAFISMRRYIAMPVREKLEALEKILFLHIDDTNANLSQHTSAINDIITALSNLIEAPPKPMRKIGFNPD